MPPRFAYWTIIAGGLPTAFRAAERDALLPTFKRIQERHPDAQMKYFARGKIWASQDEARQAAEARRSAARAPDARRGLARTSPSRGRDWRPGGEHRDPRQKFKDAKQERNLQARKRRFERRTDRPPIEKPHGDPLRRQAQPAGNRVRSGSPPKSGTNFRRGSSPKPGTSFRHGRPPKPRKRSG